MYGFRDLDPIGLAAFGLLCLAWLAGGWLLASHAFALRKGERVVAGFSLGLVLFITLANLLAGPLPLPPAFGLAGVGVLGLGLAAAAGSRKRPDRRGLEVRELADPLLLAALALTLLLALIQRGLGIFDDYLHLPLVSTLAAGDIPPHFYLNPDRPFAYHYGLQVLAAGLVRLAGFQPWSAWDLSKALAIALTACLGVLWFKRLLRNRSAALMGSLALVLGGGARWLLLLLPPPWLAALSSQVDLHNTGLDAAPDLLTALHSPWPIDGGGPIPFPFAAHNGVFLPLISVLGSTGALPYLTVLLLGLLAVRRRMTWIEAAAFTLILANLALSAEHWFALLWIALAVVLAAAWIGGRRKSRDDGLPPGMPRRAPWTASWVVRWAGVLAGSAVISLVQGGFISVAAFSTLQGWFGMEGAASSNFYGFGLRWPPAVYSAHLGVLSLFNPGHLVVLLAELGPALLLAGAASVFAARAFRRGAWMVAALGLCAALNMLFPIFVVYGVDRSVTRFPATALWLWLMLGLPAAWWAAQMAVRALRRGQEMYAGSPLSSENDELIPEHSLTRPSGPPSPGGSPAVAGGGEEPPFPSVSQSTKGSPFPAGKGDGGLGPTPILLPGGFRGDGLDGENSDHFAPPPTLRTSFRRSRSLALLAALATGYIILVGGGMVVLGVQAASIPEPQLSYYLDYLDAGMSQALWNKLEPDAQVLDPIPFRAVTLFGRASKAHDSIYVPLPEWEALVANPDPHLVAQAQAGYSHIYMDEGWWNALTPGQRQAMEHPCIDIVEERGSEQGGVRLLIDVRGCRPSD